MSKLKEQRGGQDLSRSTESARSAIRNLCSMENALVDSGCVVSSLFVLEMPLCHVLLTAEVGLVEDRKDPLDVFCMFVHNQG